MKVERISEFTLQVDKRELINIVGALDFYTKKMPHDYHEFSNPLTMTKFATSKQTIIDLLNQLTKEI